MFLWWWKMPAAADITTTAGVLASYVWRPKVAATPAWVRVRGA